MNSSILPLKLCRIQRVGVPLDKRLQHRLRLVEPDVRW